MHRLLIAPALACAVFNSAASFAGNYESAFPYEVRTVAAAVPLRCGPGDAFYVTELLDQGRPLTVYRQAAGGWLAVRPTEDSYSLLAARYTRLTTAQDVVEIVDDHAVSWVGAADEQPAEFKWQVRLKPGEKVVVMGEETRRAYPGGPRELHYRIAPPAGEFRWIHEQDVRHASQVKRTEPTSPGTVQLANFRVPVEEADSGPPHDGFVAREPRTTSPSTSLTKTGITDLGITVDRATDVRGERTRAARRAPRSRSTSQADPSPLKAPEFEQRLRDLDVQLSLMVAKPIEDWQLVELGDEVSDLIARGGSTVDRGRAQLLAEKIDAFEQLQARYETIWNNAKVASAAVTPEETAPSRPPRSSDIDPRFDGAGWLYPVHSRNQASPPYALLDADGMIIQFVSPAPGLNLNRYLRQEIGVFGQQSAGSTLDKPHVTAQRVVSLERHRR